MRGLSYLLLEYDIYDLGISNEIDFCNPSMYLTDQTVASKAPVKLQKLLTSHFATGA